MKKNAILLGLILGVGALFSSCQNDYEEIVNESIQPSVISEEIASFDATVSLDEAKTVAMQYKGLTRSVDDSMIQDVTLVKDENGQPGVYVINYKDGKGFLVLSASKNFLPVLAYADEGEFVVNDKMPSEVSGWLTGMKETIAYANQLPADSVAAYRSLWGQYVHAPEPVMTRAADEEFLNYIQECRRKWEAEGYGYATVGEAPIPSEQVRERFLSIAQGMTYIEYDYLQHSFVIWKTKNESEKKTNLLSTTWDQNNGYNADLNPINGQLPPAGCATIAMAQVMKYHEHPAYVNWAAMPDNYATTQTASFIRELAYAIDADFSLDGTGASLSNVRKALVSRYNYASSAQLVNHSARTAMDEIKNNRPVIMQGFGSNNEGHAWVASGYNYTDLVTQYDLLVMPEKFYPGGTFIFLTADSYMDIQISTYFYMNWGWGGSYNGYYYDDYLWFDRTDGRVYFDKNRKDIIGIMPN